MRRSHAEHLDARCNALLASAYSVIRARSSDLHAARDISDRKRGRAVVNKAIIVGNLGRDPEVRFTPSGRAVAKFSVATTERWTDQQGQRQEKTEWHNIVVWGKQAETCGQYLSKGRQVYVEGRIATRNYDD